MQKIKNLEKNEFEIDISKENLSSSIIPSLFYNEDSTKFLEGTQKYFSDNNINIKSLQKEFNNLEDITDKTFWNKILISLSNIYKISKIDKDKLLKLINTDLYQFIGELLKLHFDEIFVYNSRCGVRKLSNTISALKKIVGFNKNNIFLEDDNYIRVYQVTEHSIKGYVKPNIPGEATFYPYTLIKLSKKEKEIYFAGKNTKIEAIQKSLMSIAENNEILKFEDLEDFSSFKINTYDFLNNLNHHNFYLKGIKYSNKNLFLASIIRNGLINFEEIIDFKVYFNTKLDFLYLKEIKLIYSKNINKVSKDFNFTLKIVKSNLNSNYEYFTIKIIPSKSLNEDLIIEIKNKLKSLNLEVDKRYFLPIDVYFNNLIYADSKYNQKNISKIIEIEPKNNLIKDMKKNKVLKEDSGIQLFDKSEFEKYLKKQFKKLSDKSIKNTITKEKFEILSYEDNYFRVKISKNEKNCKSELFYRVYINQDLRSYNKVLYINLKNENIYFILKNILDKKETDLLEYLYLRVSNYIQFNYEENLLKEANNCSIWLEDYCKNFKKLEKNIPPNNLGLTVEKKLNVILKFLYRNYLLIGGASKPDGFLFYENESYLIDSKQHKNIHIGEIDKIQRYLRVYCENEGFPKAKYGVLIICNGKLGKTLNKTARNTWKDWTQSQDWYISFISLEFILKIYKLFNTPNSKYSNENLKEILNSVIKIIKKSKDFSTKKELIDEEKTILNQLETKIKRNISVNLPQENEEL